MQASRLCMQGALAFVHGYRRTWELRASPARPVSVGVFSMHGYRSQGAGGAGMEGPVVPFGGCLLMADVLPQDGEGVRHEARTDDGPDSAGQGVTVRAGSERDRAARRVCTAQAHAVSLPAGDRPGKVTGKRQWPECSAQPRRTPQAASVHRTRKERPDAAAEATADTTWTRLSVTVSVTHLARGSRRILLD